jgi:hypothetical protein
MIGPRGYLFLLGAAIGALSNHLGDDAPVWEKRLLGAGEGAAYGAGMGLAAGPWGAIAGAIVGAIIGGLGDKMIPWGKELAGAAVAGFHIAAADFVAIITDAKQWEQAAVQFATAVVHDIEAGFSHIGTAIGNEAKKLLETNPNAPLMQLQSYRVPEAQHTPIQLISYTTLDGRTIAKTVTDYQGRLLTAPQTGPSGYNMRASAPSSGQAIST